MDREYVVRIVVPRRDRVRVSGVVERLEKEGFLVRHRVERLFENRPDLDSFEYVFLIELSTLEVRRLRDELGKKLSGTIGFFQVYPASRY